MPVSPLAAPRTPSTLYALVAFLIRPLLTIYHAPFVRLLQSFLQSSLAAHFPGDTLSSPFTFYLSPNSAPPIPIFAVCSQLGVPWPVWMNVLGGEPMYLFVIEGRLKLRVGETGETVTIWSAGNDEPVGVPPISRTMSMSTTQLPVGGNGTESPMEIELKKMLDSVRSRRRSAEGPTKPISLPTLLPAMAAAPEPAADVVMKPVEMEGLNSEEDPGCLSDTESDDESTSSRFSDFTTESLTSLSTSSSPFCHPMDLTPLSNVSSPVSCPAELPAHPRTPEAADDKTPPATSPNRTPTQDEIDGKAPDLDVTPTKKSYRNGNPRRAHSEQGSPIQPRYLSRSQRKLFRSVVDQSKTDVTKFTYAGGQTGVMTGGVMLGAVQAKVNSTPTTTTNAKRSRGRGKKSVKDAGASAGVTNVNVDDTYDVFGAPGKGKTKAINSGSYAFPSAFSKRRTSVMLGPDSSDWRAQRA